ncbi:sulfotransferase [Candidatus Neomarinimicrobiota bacterium]
MPVLITGMHRSGTSMIARVLNLAGLDLGPEEELLPPGEGNPHGFWENQQLDQITEDVLLQLSGGWDILLPKLEQDWHKSNAIALSYDQAHLAISQLAGTQPWGWKDPRASILIPFWRTVMDDLQTVICLRHPQEVSDSLSKRVGSTQSFNYHLWLDYYRRILDDTTADTRVITHYDAFRFDPATETKRLSSWIGLNPSDTQLADAVAAVHMDSREQTAKPELVPASHLPVEVADLYNRLCDESGPVIADAIQRAKLPHLEGQLVLEPALPAPDSISEADRSAAVKFHMEALKYIEQGDREQYIGKLIKAVQTDPLAAEIRNDLAVVLANEGLLEQAEIHARLAWQLAPEYLEAASNLADIYGQLERTEDAIKVHLRIVDIDRENLESLIWLAQAALVMDNKELAAGYLDWAQSIEPNLAEILEGMENLEGE